MTIYTVYIYEDIDSYWLSKEKAEDRCNLLNEDLEKPYIYKVGEVNTED